MAVGNGAFSSMRSAHRQSIIGGVANLRYATSERTHYRLRPSVWREGGGHGVVLGIGLNHDGRIRVGAESTGPSRQRSLIVVDWTRERFGSDSYAPCWVLVL